MRRAGRRWASKLRVLAGKATAWQIHLQGQSSNVSRAAVPVPAGTVSLTPSAAATESPTYRAGNQASIRPQLLHYFKCYPSTIVIIVVGLVVAAGVAAFGEVVVPLCFVVASACFLYSEIREVRGKLYWRDQNGGIVVSLDPPLVAVLTNLTMTGQGYLPGLKIVLQPLGRMAGGPATLGMRLPTVSIYLRGKGDQIWEDYTPEVVNCVTNDPAAIEQSLQAIPEHEWAALEDALDRLNDKQPGLYLMWEPDWQADPQRFPTRHLWGNVAGIVVGLILIAGAVVPALIEKSKIQNQNQPAIEAEE
jgi:hypothetical protein